jgi:hypothetical protein
MIKALKLQVEIIILFTLVWEMQVMATPSFNESVPMKVIAKGLNVRTADGNILCSIKKNDSVRVIGRHADGQRLKVKINRMGCPKEGYVYSNFLKPDSWISSLKVSSKVEVESLSLRSSAKVNNRTYLCALPKNTLLDIIDDVDVGSNRSQWFKVKLKQPLKGCPDVGYVNGSYLVPNESFEGVPEAKDSEASMKIEQNTEGQVSCHNCEVENSNKWKSNEIVKATQPTQRNDFLEGLRGLIADPKSNQEGLITHRGLVQMPLIGSRGNIGPCGSHHYSPDKPIGVDAYANPLTACAFTSFLHDWKQNECPNSNDGCRVAWGDISHKTRPIFSGHMSHTDGTCIDIRPLRSGSFQDAPLTYKQKAYDRNKMALMVKMLKEKGGEEIIFNDRKLGTSYNTGHDNHIHVCFNKSTKTEDACNGLAINPNICPELQ